MKRLLFAVLLLPLVVLSACSRSDTPRKIVILSTNDIHAAIQNFPREMHTSTTPPRSAAPSSTS